MPTTTTAGRPAPAPNGNPLYGLGVIGALIWLWPRAHTPRDRTMAVLKALVWPASLVYEAYRLMGERDRTGEPSV